MSNNNENNQLQLTKELKQETIKEYAIHEGDVGSPEVQVAVLTLRIRSLTNHVKQNKNDIHSKRGLLILVEKRRRILKYLRSVSEERYQNLIKRLGLRK